VKRGLVVLLSAALLTGCGGGSSPASSQLQARATRVCAAANRRLQRITATDGHYEAFLQDGLAVLQPELARLAALHADPDDQAVYAGALGTLGREIKDVKSTLAGLDHHQDPALAFASLQRRLAPLESRTDAAWRALEIPACLSR
jgi:hypothetical protein